MNQKKQILSAKAPQPIGPYSQAIQYGNLLFVSGQLPIDPATGTLTGTDIATQTTQVLKNIEAILTKTGCTFDNVLKTTCFLQSMADFKAMNEVYASVFVNQPPARSTIEVAALPLGARVEIEVVASVG